jgi:hypothetical protein
MLLLGVVQAQAAGDVSFGSYDLLATEILTSTAASVTFSSLGDYASTYQHLQLRVVARTNESTNAFPGVQFNADTGSNYLNHALQGNGSSVSSSAELSRTNAVIGPLTWNVSDANGFGAIVVDFLDGFSSSKYTTLRALGGRIAGASPIIRLTSGLWRNTSSLTEIKIVNNFGGSFIAGSRFSLYGLKASV